MLIIVCLSSMITLFMFIRILSIRNKTQLQKAFICLFSLMLLQQGSFFLSLFQRFEQLAINGFYVSVILIPLCTLYIGIIFAHLKIELSWKCLLPCILPFASIVILLTNNVHHFFFVRPSIDLSIVKYGLYYFINALISFGYILVGIFYLLTFSFKNANCFSKQGFTLASGFLISLIMNTLVMLKQVFPEQLRNYFCILTPVATIFFIWLAIIRYDFLMVIPLSNRLIRDHISDGFLLLDENLCIVDFNRAFEVVFKKVAVVQRKSDLHDFAEKLKMYSDFDMMAQFNKATPKLDCAICELGIDGDSEMQYFQLEITPVYKMESFLGWVILFKDMTWLKNTIQTIEENQRLLILQKRKVLIGQLRDGIIHNMKSPIMSLAGGLESLKGLVDEYRQLIEEGCFTKEDHLEIARGMTFWVERMKPYCSTIADIVSAVKGQITSPADKTFFSLDSLLTRLKLLLRYEIKKNNIHWDIHCPIEDLLIYGSCDDLVQVLSIFILKAVAENDESGRDIQLSITTKNTLVIFSIHSLSKGICYDIQTFSQNENFFAEGPEKTELGFSMAKSIIQNSFNGYVCIDFKEGEGPAFQISIPQGV